MPIQFDGILVGAVKMVAGSEISARHFSAAGRLLELVVSGVCRESVLAMLSEEVRTLRACLAEVRQRERDRARCPNGLEPPAAASAGSAAGGETLLVDTVLSHLHRHYQTPTLSLQSVAEAIGCNPRYLTTRFTLMVGERMHTYLVRLRVAHACRLLMDTGTPIKEIAYASGFRDSTGLGRAFRRHVGVAPAEYRRIFREA